MDHRTRLALGDLRLPRVEETEDTFPGLIQRARLGAIIAQAAGAATNPDASVNEVDLAALAQPLIDAKTAEEEQPRPTPSLDSHGGSARSRRTSAASPTPSRCPRRSARAQAAAENETPLAQRPRR